MTVAIYIGVYVRNDGLSEAGNAQIFLDSNDPRDDDSIDIFMASPAANSNNCSDRHCSYFIAKTACVEYLMIFAKENALQTTGLWNQRSSEMPSIIVNNPG